MIAGDFGVGQVFLSLLVFAVAVLYVWLMIAVAGDVFSNPALSGWGKAGWAAAAVFIPFFGALAYIVVHGKEMGERNKGRKLNADLARDRAGNARRINYGRGVSRSRRSRRDGSRRGSTVRATVSRSRRSGRAGGGARRDRRGRGDPRWRGSGAR